MTANIPKVALVTDAADPLGRAVALALARRGWDIAVHYQEGSNEAAATVRAVEALGRRAAAVQCNLNLETEIRALFSLASQKLDAALFSCLVNLPSFPAEVGNDFSFAALGCHMHANLAAPILLAQALHDATPPGAQAVAVNLFDRCIFKPGNAFLPYTLSASALNTATTILAQMLAPKLRVVGVATEILRLQDRPTHDETSGMAPVPASLAWDEIAAAVCFAVESPAMTGTSLLVDGGHALATYHATQ